ncbi:MAG: DUF4292 domain-containing protein [Mediterranea sp.]|jgi:hypothetical protein|nr:DUF4292 domain-containing protein [Mediterranea sp.]
MKRATYLILLLALTLTGCRSSKHLLAPEAETTPHYLSSRLQLTLPRKQGGGMSVNGTMKMKSGECVQVSLLMPILRTEVARIEATPHQVLLVDRMGKRYVRASREELRQMFPRNAEFAQLQKLLEDAAKPDGKRELSGTDLGIPALEGSKVILYDFSTKELSIPLTQLSAQYKQVALQEFVHLLKGML